MRITGVKARWLTTTEYFPGFRSPPKVLGLLVGTSASYICLLVFAAVPATTGVGVSITAIAVLELALPRYAPIVAWALQRIQLGLIARGLFAGAAMVLFAARSMSDVAASTAVAVGLIAAAAAVGVGTEQAVTFLRTPPVLVRGLSVTVPGVPRALPGPLRRPADVSMASVVLVGLGLVLAVAAGHTKAVALVSFVIAAAIAAAAPVCLACHLLILHRSKVWVRVGAAVERALSDLGPQIAVYYGSDPAWRYQVDMWLPVLESVRQPVVVVVRDVETFALMAPTSLPVVCAPRATPLMQMSLPDLRVALYVGNTANNVHFLRRPHVTSVFVGHGDSDKGASANPITRVYNEIWVAGAAGRDRYRRADLDIADAAFVEVGRPQLRALPRVPDEEPMLTVLYAPTWEGWDQESRDSSLADIGPALIEALLATPGVRVMYRPHPQSGHRDPAMRRAHAAIVAMLRRAGAAQPTAPPPRIAPADSAPGDALDQMLAADVAFDPRTAAQEQAQWSAQYWKHHRGHRILVPPAPDLMECFTRTDILIADISSVITDFLAADRPYAVVEPGGGVETDFPSAYPSAGGGFVLTRTLESLDEILGAGAGGPDPTASARRTTALALLGPRPDDPAEPFRAALDRLCPPPRATAHDLNGT